MGMIFYLMGKSATGKDTFYQQLLTRFPALHPLVTYTTRPIRTKERNGVEYHFTDEAHFRKLEQAGRVIEKRVYQTALGPWIYFTADDQHIDLSSGNYLGIGTLSSWQKLAAYYGREVVIPLYIETEDGVRLTRALKREQKQETPQYAEMCRRFLADQDDFSEEKLEQAGITRRFLNNEAPENCLNEIIAYLADTFSI